MSAHGKSRKLVLLAGVLCLMVAAAFGGYAAANNRALANSRVPETVNLAGGQAGASGQDVTVHACLASGKLTRVSVAAAPKCPARSVPVQWSVQSGPASSPGPLPSPAPSSSRPPSSSGLGTPCVTSSDSGSCGPYDYAGISGGGGNQASVIQDVWNPVKGASQKLTAYNPGNWSVSADMPASNTAVVSYPDAQETYTTASDTPSPLSDFSSITSSFAENGPASRGDDYEAAYDIWTGTGNNNFAQEIMIWVDNHGQTPAGSDVASAAIGGVGYKVWSTSRAGTVGDTVSMVLDSNRSSGSVNILADLNWLESNGYLPAGSGLNQIDFGWEICSTGGVPETFTLSQYRITAS